MGTDDRAHAVGIAAAFVAGAMDARAFEQLLYRDVALERLLGAAPAPRHSPHGVTLFQHLIALDYGDLRDVVDAHESLAGVLSAEGVPVVASADARERLLVIHSAQPRWLDADTAYLSALLERAPPGQDARAWLKVRILELFRFAKRPPRWLQSPQWPMGKAGPMVFLGQVAVDDYFHDHGAAYVFHDPATGECRTIVQTV